MKKIILLLAACMTLLTASNVYADYLLDPESEGEHGCWLYDGYNSLSFDKDSQTFSFANSNRFATEAGLDCYCSFLRGNIDIPSEMEFKGSKYPVVEISTFSQNKGVVYNVTIPASIEKISDFSFYWVDINSITFSEGLETIGNSCFSFCNANKEDPQSTGLKELILPESIRNIGQSCFCMIPELEKIRIPSNLLSIKKSCFAGLPHLKELTLPQKLISIEENCFTGCGFESITFPQTLTKIGEGSFFGCGDLRTIILPSHQVECNSVFANCPAIETVVCPSEAYDIDEDSFNEVNFRKCTLFVPKEYVEDFRQAKGWSRFKNIRGFDSGVDNVLSSGTAVRIEGRYVFADTDIEIYDNNGIRVLSIAKDGSAQLDKGNYIWKSSTDAGKIMVK